MEGLYSRCCALWLCLTYNSYTKVPSQSPRRSRVCVCAIIRWTPQPTTRANGAATLVLVWAWVWVWVWWSRLALINCWPHVTCWTLLRATNRRVTIARILSFTSPPSSYLPQAPLCRTKSVDTFVIVQAQPTPTNKSTTTSTVTFLRRKVRALQRSADALRPLWISCAPLLLTYLPSHLSNTLAQACTNVSLCLQCD